MALPDVTQTVQDGALAITQQSGQNVQIVLGCSDDGDDFDLRVESDPDQIVADFGRGPLSDSGSLGIRTSQSPVILGKLPIATPGAAGAVTNSSSGSSTLSVSGTPNDDYDVVITPTREATLGAGDEAFAFTYSLDGGIGTSAEVRVHGAAPVTYDIPNSGISLSFGAGTIKKDGSYTFATTAPLWDSGDFAEMFAKIKVLSSGQDFGFIQVVGPMDATDAAILTPLVDDMSNGQHRNCSWLGNVRDFDGDSEADWMTAIGADYASFIDGRAVIGAGHMRLTGILHKWTLRRAIAMAAGARAQAGNAHTMISRRKDGAIKFAGQDLDKRIIYHDERAVPGLNAERFLTTRTVANRIGAYFTDDPTMALPGSDYSIWPNRRVMDKLCKAMYVFWDNEVNDSVIVDADGFIQEKDARDMELRADAAADIAVKAPGDVSDVANVVNRSTNILSTRTLKVKTQARPLGYKSFIEETLSFTTGPVNQG